MLTEDQLSKLLNRSLTTAETTNFSLYLNIASEKLSDLLCNTFSVTAGERTYKSRYGYKEVYIDICSTVSTVYIDNVLIEESDYTLKQNDKYTGTWYNIIEFDDKRDGDTIQVNAAWTFSTLPNDLQLLLAKLFAQNTTDQTTDYQVKSKKIEDFTVTYKDSPTYNEFILSNSSTIDKYSQCNVSQIRHGSVRGSYDFRSIR